MPSESGQTQRAFMSRACDVRDNVLQNISRVPENVDTLGYRKCLDGIENYGIATHAVLSAYLRCVCLSHRPCSRPPPNPACT